MSAETLRAAIDQAADSIVIVDPRGRIVYANLAAERHIGRPRSALIGTHFVSLTTGRDVGQDDEISRVVGEGGTWSGAYVATTSGGRLPVAVDLVVSPVRDTAGRVSHVVAIGRDGTRERSLEGDLAREVRHRADMMSTISRLEASDSVEAQARELADALMLIEDISFARVIGLGPGDVWYAIAAPWLRGH